MRPPSGWGPDLPGGGGGVGLLSVSGVDDHLSAGGIQEMRRYGDWTGRRRPESSFALAPLPPYRRGAQERPVGCISLLLLL